MRTPRIPNISAVLFTLALVAFLYPAAAPRAADITFAVQPILDEEATRKAFQPLADYIARATGKSVELKTSYDYAEYWLKMKQGQEFDLILDAPFYTDYRIQHQGHVPLVKVPGLVSYSLIAPSIAGVFDATELIGKKIATLIPPAPGGLVMARMFPNPSRQPYIVPVKSSEQAMELLLQGRVDAAFVPTPLVAKAMGEGKDIATITTSPQTPHISLTAWSSSVDAETRAKISQALLDAGKTPAGKQMLRQIGFPEGFEAATKETYHGYSDYLTQRW